MKFYTR
jgi:hypothetical protein